MTQIINLADHAGDRVAVFINHIVFIEACEGMVDGQNEYNSKVWVTNDGTPLLIQQTYDQIIEALKDGG